VGPKKAGSALDELETKNTGNAYEMREPPRTTHICVQVNGGGRLEHQKDMREEERLTRWLPIQGKGTKSRKGKKRSGKRAIGYPKKIGHLALSKARLYRMQRGAPGGTGGEKAIMQGERGGGGGTAFKRGSKNQRPS